MANPRAGKILQGRYRLRSILAEGGMGVVWQAERVGIERPVVIKFLQAVLSDRPGAVDRFEREARATARLNHPNCVQLVDFGLDEGQPYLVVEFVEGQTVAEQLDHGPLEPRRAVRIIIQVLAGLIHAHDRGILHRDLKPANLMIVEAVGYEDFVKILDFGLAKIIGEADRREVTVHGVALGTPGYMSPEQAAGMPADLRADIYSSGAVLYHLLTGVKVFEGTNVHSILRKHRENTPPPPRSLRGPGSISAELDAIVAKSMQRDPAKRFQNAAEMRRALEGVPEVRNERRSTTGGRKAVVVEEEGATRVGRPTPRVQPAVRVPPAGGAAWSLVVGIALTTTALGAGSAFWLSSIKEHPAVAETDSIPVVVASPPVVQVRPLLVDAAVAAVVADSGIVTTPIPPAPDAVVVADDDHDDGASEDVHVAPDPPAAAPHREAREVRTIADVRVLVRRGETDTALSGLYALRRRGLPRDKEAEVATLLGHLYFDRRWMTDGLKEYRYALSLDVRARTDQTIINNTVLALSDSTNAARARRVLIDYVGRSAIPALRRAGDRPEFRARAEAVLAKLGAGER